MLQFLLAKQQGVEKEKFQNNELILQAFSILNKKFNINLF